MGVVSEWICFRCDWTGGRDGAACPRCGAALYRIPEPKTPREVTPPPRPQPRPAGDRMPSSPIEAAQDSESAPPTAPVAASRRRAVIIGALTVTAVWIVATVGPFGRDQTPAVPGGGQTGPAVTGPAETGPSVTGPFYPEQVGYVLPPEGTSPSAPERGKLVASKEDIHPWYAIYVYADGRMIWGRERLTGRLERRLTPEGVALVRSGAVRLDGAVPSLDPASALPQSALEDRLIKAYVPARFAVCSGYWPGDTGSLELSSILAHLPVPAQALLRGNERMYDASGGVTGGNPSHPSTPVECFEVTAQEARALDRIFRDSGIERIDQLDDSTPLQWVVFELKATAGLRQSFISMMPLLPHGEWGFLGGG
jgi:hypothetical protein